jgi:hypothetical protein
MVVREQVVAVETLAIFALLRDFCQREPLNCCPVSLASGARSRCEAGGLAPL